MEGKTKMVFYIKLHAPWDVCCFYAEDLCMRAPLQVRQGGVGGWFSGWD